MRLTDEQLIERWARHGQCAGSVLMGHGVTMCKLPPRHEGPHESGDLRWIPLTVGVGCLNIGGVMAALREEGVIV